MADLKKLTEQLKGASKTPVAPAAPKLEKLEKKRGKDKGKHGGKRNNSGRKPLEEDEKRVTLKRSYENYAGEEDDVTVKRLENGTVVQRREKMARIRVLQEALYKKAREGDVSAIKEFNDRVLGKSRQPIVGDDEEPPVQIDLGIGDVLDRATDYDDDSTDE